MGLGTIDGNNIFFCLPGDIPNGDYDIELTVSGVSASPAGIVNSTTDLRSCSSVSSTPAISHLANSNPLLGIASSFILSPSAAVRRYS